MKDKITVLMSSSPIPSNPDTKIIDETINSVRKHLPDSEILLMLDGVQEKDNVDNYEEFKRRIIWKCQHEWHNVLPIVFSDHQHQANMTRKALESVRTDFILFVEHDTPLVDRPIDWEGLIKVIDSGYSNVIRFYYYDDIPKEHDYLMLDKQPITVFNVPLIRTAQWSQRPHLSTTNFYKIMLEKYIDSSKKVWIEDYLYGNIVDSIQRGEDEFKISIYAPDPMMRSYHLDGSEGIGK